MTVVMMPGVRMQSAPRGSAARRKFSIALSGRAADLFTEIKEITDAETDSEVFRNALRLNYMLLKAGNYGMEVCMRDLKSGELHPVLFGESDSLVEAKV